MLGHGDQDRLMVSSAVDRRKLVDSGRKTVADFSGQNTTLSSTVEALEELEALGVKRGGLSE